MVYCRPYYSQESRKANEKFVMDCHYSICDTYGGCRGVTSKLNLSLHLTAFVFWNTYFFPGDHNTNRIPTFSKPTPRELKLNKGGCFSLLTVRKELPFRFSRAAKRQGVLDRIFLFVLIEDCVFWPKATWKPWEKNCRSIAPLTFTTAAPCPVNIDWARLLWGIAFSFMILICTAIHTIAM